MPQATAYAPTEPIACRLFVWATDRPHVPPPSTGLAVFIAHCGVEGLARIEGDHLHVQDVYSSGPGCFRRFVEQAKAEFAAITAWNVWSHIARDALLRYDFEPTRGRDASRKPVAGLTWPRERQAEITSARERVPGTYWKGLTVSERIAAEDLVQKALAMQRGL